jgi:hypothetical protein
MALTKLLPGHGHTDLGQNDVMGSERKPCSSLLNYRQSKLDILEIAIPRIEQH